MAKRITINECQKYAESKGGKCLSEEYDPYAKTKWQCGKCNHIFDSKYRYMKSDKSWCPKCAGRLNNNIDICHKIAKERGGKCLSDVYKDNKKYLKWECSEGHQWETSLDMIKNSKQWCPNCAGVAKLNIDICHKIAKERGGKCLTEEYSNIRTLIEWECDKGHKWKANIHNVKDSESWCPYCSGKFNNNIELCKELAEKRGGKCLSEKYVNNRSPLHWECDKGHQWYANLDNVKNAYSWCPTCSSYKSEALCREYIESYFMEPFEKVRPKWLEKLELDGYIILDIELVLNIKENNITNGFHIFIKQKKTLNDNVKEIARKKKS